MKRKVFSARGLKKLVYSAIFLAFAYTLPFLTGNIPQIGSALSPMHIPTLLCGFVCGWQWGAVVGFIAPLLRGLIIGMPPIIPRGLAMAFELATYGAAAGLLYRLLPKKLPYIYLDLIISMIVGRLVWGAATYVIAGLRNTSFGLSAFWAGAVANAVPGIIVQLVLIPILVITLKNAKLSLNE